MNKPEIQANKDIKPYDVLQIERDGQWLDFSTLRSQADFDEAKYLVDTKAAYTNADWEGKSFRVVRVPSLEVIYEASKPAIEDAKLIQYQITAQKTIDILQETGYRVTWEYPGYIAILLGADERKIQLNFGTVNPTWSGETTETPQSSDVKFYSSTIPSDSTDAAAIAAWIKSCLNHTHDAQCLVGDDNLCLICGVEHVEACAECGGRAFHRPPCTLTTNTKKLAFQRASQEFADAAMALVEAWDEDTCECTDYPKEWPSFDELMHAIVGWNSEVQSATTKKGR